MQRIFVALALISTIIFSGCAKQRVYGHLYVNPPGASYRLAAGDRLRVIVFGQDSLSNTYSVDTAGNISMPLIGTVRAQGHSPTGLAKKITARLRNGFVREPRVSVEVDAYRPFFVLGEVTTAGQYPYVNDLTVQKAVAIAGGFAPRAYKKTVNLTRVIEGQPVTLSVRLDQLVQPGDTVMVRERYF
jgi:polysaccharide biosynthesis/export protein